jgi:prepilin-type N-terminal cleavage/methylation domain-containing protein
MIHEKGFTLVELIVTIVLVGIIGTFTTLFMYTGLNGYLRAKDTAEGALKAQIALDRISLELRDINQIEAFTANNTIDYFSTALPGDRQIIFDANARTISLDVDGDINTLNILLDEVGSFAMAVTANRDLNNSGDAINEVEAINVSFTVGEIGRQFSARIFPRNMVAELDCE